MLVKTFIAVSLLFTASSTSAAAADFSKGSNAKGWNLNGEVKSTFSGKVVDLMCELTGDCPANCGDGNRYMGILRDADGKLINVLKNTQASFNGSVEDLLPYCNQKVDVDGLMIGEDEEYRTRFYMVQKIRKSGDEKWLKANRWTKAWKVKNPDAKGKGPWFRRDPRVKKQLAATGHFGLGLEFDKKYLEENE